MALKDSDRVRVVAAIRGAERGSRGEVRVHVEERCKGDALDRARALFGELRMHETREHTGVLLYVATRDRKTAVFADRGIHGATDAAFWAGVANDVARGFAAGDGAAGLIAALGRIGDLLRAHQPSSDAYGDELPNEVSTS